MPRSSAAGAPGPRRRACRPTGAYPARGNKPSGTRSWKSRRFVSERRKRCNRNPWNRGPTVRPRISPTRSCPQRATCRQCPSRGSRPSPNPTRRPNRRTSGRLSKTTWRPGPPYRRRKAYWDRGTPRRPHPDSSCGRSPTDSADRRYRYSTTSRRACAERSPWRSSTTRSAAREWLRGTEFAKGSPASRRSRRRPMRPWPRSCRPRASGRGREPPCRNSCQPRRRARSRGKADALSVSCCRNLPPPPLLRAGRRLCRKNAS